MGDPVLASLCQVHELSDSSNGQHVELVEVLSLLVQHVDVQFALDGINAVVGPVFSCMESEILNSIGAIGGELLDIGIVNRTQHRVLSVVGLAIAGFNKQLECAEWVAAKGVCGGTEGGGACGVV